MNSAGLDVSDWQEDLRVWLEPFLAALGRSEQRHWAPLYVQGLLGPGARKRHPVSTPCGRSGLDRALMKLRVIGLVVCPGTPDHT